MTEDETRGVVSEEPVFGCRDFSEGEGVEGVDC